MVILALTREQLEEMRTALRGAVSVYLERPTEWPGDAKLYQGAAEGIQELLALLPESPPRPNTSACPSWLDIPIVQDPALPEGVLCLRKGLANLHRGEAILSRKALDRIDKCPANVLRNPVPPEELVPEHVLEEWNVGDFRRNPVPYPAPPVPRVLEREDELEELVRQALQLLADQGPSELQRNWLERARSVLE